MIGLRDGIHRKHAFAALLTHAAETLKSGPED
jgi:hypothetical protein